MDEPTSALDPISTLKIEELMNDLKKRYTVVMVTHNMQQAARVKTACTGAPRPRYRRFVSLNQILHKPAPRDLPAGRFQRLHR